MRNSAGRMERVESSTLERATGRRPLTIHPVTNVYMVKYTQCEIYQFNHQVLSSVMLNINKTVTIICLQGPHLPTKLCTH